MKIPDHDTARQLATLLLSIFTQMIRITPKYIILLVAFVLLQVRVGLGQCLPPTLVQASSTGIDSIAVQWLYFGDATGWEMELVPRGSTPTLAPTTGVITERQYVFHDLLPATSYTIFIRTVCIDGSMSEWNPVVLRTHIPQPSPCQFELPIKNNNCNQGLEAFQIAVHDTPGLLGDDVFLSSVEIIMEHSWPADIDLRLVSPSGVEVALSQNNGTVTDHYGDVTDTLCEAVTIFSDLACEAIGSSRPPFVGIFTPESPLFGVEDGTPANGIWSLSMCDRSDQDVGTLRYAQLVFEPLLCEIPRDILVKAVDARQVEVVWSSYEGCELTEVELTLQGDPTSIRTTSVPCDQEFVVIDDLEPNTAYDIYVLSNCLAGQKSPLSCPFTFTTACTEVSEVESFDQLTDCTPGCSFDCELSSIWSNSSETDDQDWLLWSRPTSTDDTGPSTGVFGGGSYIYVEASPDICAPQATALLESACVTVTSNAEQCDFSFWYHMYGAETGSLLLLANANEADSWDTIFHESGDQGNAWQNEVVSLQAYDGSAVRFQFVALTGDGSRSDIAIDQLEFRGSIATAAGYRYYQDLDQDGFGNEDFAFDLCTTVAPPSLVDVAGDCVDNNENINPDAEEIECNAIDENCNGFADDSPENNPIQYTATITDELCTTPGSGSVVLEVTAGSGPFSYLWSNDSTGSTLQGLTAGTYQCTIQDSEDCQIVTDAIEVEQVGGVSITLDSLMHASCNGKADGYVAVSAASGSAPYTFLWSDGHQNAEYPNVKAGSYTVWATDAMGCNSDSLEIIVPAEGSIEADISFMVSPSCFGATDGILQADALTGTSPHSYLWSSGEPTKLITSKAAGEYACTITDSEGCLTELTAVLVAPAQLTTTVVSQENVECNGGLTGSITTSVTGGQPPYTFAWSSGQKTDDIFDLEAGQYQLTVTDANACAAMTDTVTITQPTLLQAAVDSALFASCILSSDGYLSVLTEGGSGTYSYFWSAISADSAVVIEATPGTYNVTITDANNCKTTINNYQLAATNLPLTVQTNTVGTNLCANDAEVDIVAITTDGQLPIDYNWSSGQQQLVNSTTDTLPMLPAGIYQVTVTDAEGCIGISTPDTVTAATPLSIAVTVQHNALCYDDTDGMIDIATAGGSPPYNYNWSHGDSTSTTDQLPIGKYEVTITDANECELISQSISVNGPLPFEIEVATTPTGTGSSDGSITLTVNGATSPYSYGWPDGIAVSTANTAVNLDNGEYDITITDANMCDTIITIAVPILSSTNDAETEGIAIYPNPVTDYIHLVSKQAHIIDYDIYDVAGRSVPTKNSSTGSDIEINTEHWLPGIYIIVIHTASSRVTSRIVKT